MARFRLRAPLSFHKLNRKYKNTLREKDLDLRRRKPIKLTNVKSNNFGVNFMRDRYTFGQR